MVRQLSLGAALPAVAALAWWQVAVAAAEPEPDRFRAQRQKMVAGQIRDRGVTNRTVLAAMEKVPRHNFVGAEWQPEAYSDRPLPIGSGQTISQPYIVALMTEALDPRPGQRILEVGTGSGYQAAVLAQITSNVYTIEIVQPLYETARERLRHSGLKPEQVRQGDGYFGWKEAAPFDAIIVTAAADHIPPPLLQQLRPGGRMIIPVGPVYATQRLVQVDKSPQGKITTRSILPVRFVPLTGGPRNAEPRP